MIKSGDFKSKNQVDIDYMQGVKSPLQGTDGRDKAEGKRKPIIGEIFWDEFLTVAKALVMIDNEADFYDVFVFIRDYYNACQPLSPSTIARADRAVERELGPWE